MQLDQYRSQFDAIMSVGEDGRETWSARNLMEIMGYEEWRKFAGAIDRTKVMLENMNMDVTSQIVPADKLAPRGQGGATQRKTDYNLSRFAAYVLAMNGDPRKKEIARAQAYFATMTRIAEVSQEAEDAKSDLSLAELGLAEQKQLTDDMYFRLRVSEKRREDLEQENAELREIADRNEFDRAGIREQLFSLLEATDRQ